MASGQSSKRYTKIRKIWHDNDNLHSCSKLTERMRLLSEEFAAHAGAVNCLKIGRKSSGVLVTGGEDKKVNVWAIGRAAPIMASMLLKSYIWLHSHG
jgi:hypothetical protein